MITQNHMIQYVRDNEHLISVKDQGNGLFVLKYKNKVFYKSLWTPEMCELRGTVVDADYNIVSRPFTKIFNFGEKKAPKFDDDERVYAVTKVNGFMGAATWHDGELLVSTTGTTNSDYAKLAKTYIESKQILISDYPNFTFIFEIVDVSDPHVVEEKFGAYLLGARKKDWGASNHDIDEIILDTLAANYGFRRPAWKVTTFGEVRAEVRNVNHEGFVVYTEDGKELKFKSPFYLATKFFGRKTQERLTAILDDPREAKKIIDEEYYVAIEYLADHKDKFLAMNEQDRFAFLRDYFEKEVL